MKLKQIEFKTHGLGPPHQRIIIKFDNGYGASVVSGPKLYSSEDGPYELAVMRGDDLCYDTPIAGDVLGWRTGEEVNALLEQISALDDPIDLMFRFQPYTKEDV